MSNSPLSMNKFHKIFNEAKIQLGPNNPSNQNNKTISTSELGILKGVSEERLGCKRHVAIEIIKKRTRTAFDAAQYMNLIRNIEHVGDPEWYTFPIARESFRGKFNKNLQKEREFFNRSVENKEVEQKTEKPKTFTRENLSHLEKEKTSSDRSESGSGSEEETSYEFSSGSESSPEENSEEMEMSEGDNSDGFGFPKGMQEQGSDIYMSGIEEEVFVFGRENKEEEKETRKDIDLKRESDRRLKISQKKTAYVFLSESSEEERVKKPKISSKNDTSYVCTERLKVLLHADNDPHAILKVWNNELSEKQRAEVKNCLTKEEITILNTVLKRAKKSEEKLEPTSVNSEKQIIEKIINKYRGSNSPLIAREDARIIYNSNDTDKIVKQLSRLNQMMYRDHVQKLLSEEETLMKELSQPVKKKRKVKKQPDIYTPEKPKGIEEREEIEIVEAPSSKKASRGKIEIEENPIPKNTKSKGKAKLKDIRKESTFKRLTKKEVEYFLDTYTRKTTQGTILPLTNERVLERLYQAYINKDPNATLILENLNNPNEARYNQYVNVVRPMRELEKQGMSEAEAIKTLGFSTGPTYRETAFFTEAPVQRPTVKDIMKQMQCDEATAEAILEAQYGTEIGNNTGPVNQNPTEAEVIETILRAYELSHLNTSIKSQPELTQGDVGTLKELLDTRNTQIFCLIWKKLSAQNREVFKNSLTGKSKKELNFILIHMDEYQNLSKREVVVPTKEEKQVMQKAKCTLEKAVDIMKVMNQQGCDLFTAMAILDAQSEINRPKQGKAIQEKGNWDSLWGIEDNKLLNEITSSSHANLLVTKEAKSKESAGFETTEKLIEESIQQEDRSEINRIIERFTNEKGAEIYNACKNNNIKEVKWILEGKTKVHQAFVHIYSILQYMRTFINSKEFHGKIDKKGLLGCFTGFASIAEYTSKLSKEREMEKTLLQYLSQLKEVINNLRLTESSALEEKNTIMSLRSKSIDFCSRFFHATKDALNYQNPQENGQTPLDVAQKAKNEELVNLLSKYDAKKSASLKKKVVSKGRPSIVKKELVKLEKAPEKVSIDFFELDAKLKLLKECEEEGTMSVVELINVLSTFSGEQKDLSEKEIANIYKMQNKRYQKAIFGSLTADNKKLYLQGRLKLQSQKRVQQEKMNHKTIEDLNQKAIMKPKQELGKNHENEVSGWTHDPLNGFSSRKELFNSWQSPARPQEGQMNNFGQLVNSIANSRYEQTRPEHISPIDWEVMKNLK